MVNMYVKMGSTRLVIREMQIKAAVRYPLHLEEAIS